MIFTIESQLLERIAVVAAPGTILKGTFEQIDFTDDMPDVLAGQLVFSALMPADQVGATSRHMATWSFDVLLDVAKATANDRILAGNLISDGIKALVDYEFAPGRSVRIAEGRESGYDGRVLRVSIGITLPVYVTGT